MKGDRKGEREANLTPHVDNLANKAHVSQSPQTISISAKICKATLLTITMPGATHND